MTLWTSPVPLHLAGSQAAPAPAASAGASSSSTSSTSGGMTPSATDEAPAPAVGGLAPPPAAAANGSRRQTLPTVPTAAAVEQGQAKWLEFAPTSPQRRASFVTEPGAVEGNPFEIYREPARSDAVLGTQSFYEAGTSYIKDSSNALGTSTGSSMSLGQSASAPRLPAVAPIMGAPSSTTPPPPLGPARSASTGSLHNVTAAPAPAPTGNPFYDGAPLSPIRYNKPIAKVELSPSSHALFSQAFSDLDPLKRAESPTARVPLDQLKEHRAQLELQQQQQQQQLQLQLQQQLQQQAVAAEHGWGGWPQQQQQPQPQQGGFADPSASLNASFGAMSLGQQQPQFPPPAPAQSGWADFSAPPVASQPPQAWPPAAPAAASAGNDGFDLLAGAGAGNNATGAAAAAAAAAAGSLFDPVRQKSLADASFDLGVVAYFPEEEEDEAGGGLDASHASHGPGDGHEHHDEDIDGSWGGGHAEFEIQDDHLVAEDRERAGSASGLLYEVAFAAPTQFGMLLERKDEWTRGTVQRRERTVVTLVVEGGEAEAKGVSTGSMIVSINGEDVTALTYKETLERIKSPVRPMRVLFEREPQQKEEVLQGYYFVSKGPFFSNPTSMDKWKRKYVVLGGPIAKKNVLQIYDSKRAYHNTVVALFQRKRPQHRVKTYALTYAFKLSPMQERKMEGHTAPLKFFAFMTPGARFKSIRVASETKKSVQALHDRFGRFAGAGGKR